ncbi:MAG: GNAT family N-acetyltransferase, partial [Desulfobacterales bacterium]|nr:GNAT family N-acetyltransferase [Desulfobacterales bacterium]
ELQNNIRAIREKGGEVIVAAERSEVVGCVCVLMDARLAEGVYAEIVSLVVSENCRGTGIGKGLVTEAEKWSGEKVNKIRVRANAIRDNAHRFYKSLGYDEIKTQKIFRKTV